MNWKFSRKVVEVKKKVISDYFHGAVFQDPIIVAPEHQELEQSKYDLNQKHEQLGILIH